MAMVIVKTTVSPGMFVAAGRSMAEVEQRTGQMRTMVFIAWLICLFIIVITALLNQFVRQRKVN
jgi:lipopolysaccharide export LptBFGC system permease protein LptF